MLWLLVLQVIWFLIHLYLAVVPDDDLRLISEEEEQHAGGGQHGVFNALDYRKIKQGNAGKLGTYDILSVLPDKFARFLFEFHAYRFESLDLPLLPADRSDFDVHGALLDDKVQKYLIMIAWTLTQNERINYMLSISLYALYILYILWHITER